MKKILLALWVVVLIAGFALPAASGEQPIEYGGIYGHFGDYCGYCGEGGGSLNYKML